MEDKIECPHKWISIYVDSLDYECELCGKNLFTVYGAEKFQSGELKVENFYINKRQLVDWSRYRIIKISHRKQEFVIQVKEEFLWWSWWSSIKEYDFPCYYGGGGSWRTLYFDSFGEAVDYIVDEKVNHLKRLL